MLVDSMLHDTHVLLSAIHALRPLCVAVVRGVRRFPLGFPQQSWRPHWREPSTRTLSPQRVVTPSLPW